MVTLLLNAPPRVVNRVSVTSIFLSPVIVTGAFMLGASCSSGRE